MTCAIGKVTLTMDPSGVDPSFSVELRTSPTGTPLLTNLRENRKLATARSAVGRLKAVGGGYKPTLNHILSAVVSQDEKLKLLKMIALQETEPQTVVAFKNEYERISTIEAAWYGSRSIVSASTVTSTSGLQECYLQYPVFLICLS